MKLLAVTVLSVEGICALTAVPLQPRQTILPRTRSSSQMRCFILRHPQYISWRMIQTALWETTPVQPTTLPLNKLQVQPQIIHHLDQAASITSFPSTTFTQSKMPGCKAGRSAAKPACPPIWTRNLMPPLRIPASWTSSRVCNHSCTSQAMEIPAFAATK